MQTKIPLVAMNDHARKHTKESGYSHYEGGFDALCKLVADNINSAIILADDADGQVIKVTLPGDGFYTPVVIAESGMEFTGKFAPRDRTEGEYPYIHQRAKGGNKLPATSASIILYNHSKLAKKNENSTDADWEVVSINAQRDDSNEPPHPVTMLRNARNYPGGTKTEYTLDQVLDSIEYWFGGGPNPPHVMLDC